MGVVRGILLFLCISKADIALTGGGLYSTLVGMIYSYLPEQQTQIHFGRPRASAGQLPVPGITGTDWYLAGDETEGYALFRYKNVEHFLHNGINLVVF